MDNKNPLENFNQIEKNNLENNKDLEDDDLDLLEYELDQVNQELIWQHQVPEIEKLKIRKKELEEKIKNLK